VVTLNGGAGDDTFDLGAFADTTMVLNGGAGTDTIQYTAALTAAEGAQATSIERIFLDGNISQDMSVFSNTTATIIKMDGNAAATRAGAEITTLELNDGFTTSASFARTTDPAAGALTIDVKQAVSATSLSAAQEETITIDADTAAITLATGITATDLTTFIASGDNAVDLSTVTNTLVASVDVSGMSNADFEASFTGSTVALTVTANTATSNTGSLIITTGAGADTLNGTVTGDTLVGGLGADTIRGNDNATGDTETLTGGGGIDTFVFESTAALNGIDTITDFTAGTGGDKLDVSAFADGFTVDITGYTTASNSDVDIANKVVLLEGSGGSAANVRGEVQGAANAFNLASGGKAVVIGDDGTHSYVWFIDDTLDGTSGTVSTTDIVQVATLSSVADVDALVAANIDAVA
jgi:Ca2+-binding RTX toxin-like protein